MITILFHFCCICSFFNMALIITTTKLPELPPRTLFSCTCAFTRKPISVLCGRLALSTDVFCFSFIQISFYFTTKSSTSFVTFLLTCFFCLFLESWWILYFKKLLYLTICKSVREIEIWVRWSYQSLFFFYIMYVKRPIILPCEFLIHHWLSLKNHQLAFFFRLEAILYWNMWKKLCNNTYPTHQHNFHANGSQPICYFKKSKSNKEFRLLAEKQADAGNKNSFHKNNWKLDHYKNFIDLAKKSSKSLLIPYFVWKSTYCRPFFWTIFIPSPMVRGFLPILDFRTHSPKKLLNELKIRISSKARFKIIAMIKINSHWCHTISWTNLTWCWTDLTWTGSD